MKTKREAALAYARLGYEVFPCRPGTKVPMTEHGFLDATTDGSQIEAWWARSRDANVAIRTDGLVVVDVDGEENGWPGDPEREASLSEAPMSRTPRRGSHRVFRQPRDRPCSSTVKRLAPNIDTRANGGYILVPPSVVEGSSYVWVEGRGLNFTPEELSEVPEWILEGLEATEPQGKAREDSPPIAGNAIPKGQRNNTLARLAGSMRRNGMTQSEISSALLVINEERCRPPLASREVERVAKSIVRYDPDQITVAAVENHWAQDRAECVDPGPVDPGPIPVELLRVPGFVSEVMDFTMDMAPYPNQVLAFGGALALQAVLAGRKVRDPGDNRTNLYLLGLAHSSGGKDFPRKVNARILHEVGLSGCLGERFASGEGIQDALFQTPSMLFQTDEIDGLLLAINQTKDARHEGIVGTLLTMYSSANTVVPMRRKAGQETPGVIDQPCLVLFGSAIPNHLYSSLSERLLTNGFVARMIILESWRRGKGQEPKVRPIPLRIVESARWWAEGCPRAGNLESVFPAPLEVPYTDEGRRILVEAREVSETEYALSEERNDPVGTTVWGRVNEHARKLALLYAASESRDDPKISAAAARWAVDFVEHHTRRMLFMAENHLAESPFQVDCLKVLRKLREAPGQTLAHSVLLKRMKMDAQSFRKLISTLSQRGEVLVDEARTAGRKGTAYRLLK